MIADSRGWRQALLRPFRGMSLKSRLMVTTVSLFVVFIWAATFLSATVLEQPIQHLIFDQQLATTRQIAAGLDQKLKDDIDGLQRAVRGLPADLSYASLQPLLAQRPLMHVAFSGGITVIGLDGKVIADFPVAPGRRDLYVGDRDYFQQAIATNRPYVAKPIIGRTLKRPLLVLAVPVPDAAGKPRAVMTGVIDLAASNFLAFVTDPELTGHGEYFVVSLRDDMVIAATDKRRSLTPTPARGRNLFYDRMKDGFEGSEISVSSEGIEKLYSGVRVPTADWIVFVGLRTQTAFGPVRQLQDLLYLVATLMTLMAILVIRYMVRRMLAPLGEASDAMQQMASGRSALAPLTVQGKDEIGWLVRSFNELVADRRKYETALAESERRFRLLVESAPEGIFVQVQGCFVYANRAMLDMLGATREEELLGQPVLNRIHPDFRPVVMERIRLAADSHQPSPAFEERYLRLDGSPFDVEVSAVPCRYGDDDAALVFVRDITKRRELEQDRAKQARHLADLSRRLIRVQESERRHLSAELHDSTSPNLAALAISLRSIASELAPAAVRGNGKSADDIGILIDDAMALLKDASTSIRNICADLRPPVLDYAGLLPALESYAQQFAYRTGIDVQVDYARPMERLAPELETTLFRIAQEALTNCAKHAQATSVRISLSSDGGRVALAIDDDGRGFSPAELGLNGRSPGQGLLAMRERTEFAGGTISIASQPGEGTHILVDIPLATEPAAPADIAPPPVAATEAGR